MRKDLYRQIRDESIVNILKLLSSGEKSRSQRDFSSMLKEIIELKFVTILKFLNIIRFSILFINICSCRHFYLDCYSEF